MLNKLWCKLKWSWCSVNVRRKIDWIYYVGDDSWWYVIYKLDRDMFIGLDVLWRVFSKL